MVTFADLRQAEPAAYRRAAQAWTALTTVIEQQGGAVTARSGDLAAVWQGAAGDAATTQLTGIGQDFTDGATRARGIPTALDQHASQVQFAKFLADTAVAVTTPTPVRVAETGAVTLTPAAYAVPAMVPLWQGFAGQVQSVVNTAVETANATDAATTAQLRALLPTGGRTAAAPTGAPTPTVPAPGTDPQAVHDWWTSLTDEQRADLLANDPAAIGALDGIPAVDRDTANRSVLASEQDRLEARRDELEGMGDSRSDGQDGELDLINEQLGGIQAINDRIADTGPGKQDVFLLGFDTNDLGHAIVAIGNPDTADNVVTYVPGTGTKLGDVGGDLGRADVMIDSARAADPSESTSAIVWIGYDAPQDIINTDLGELGQDATNDRYAEGARDDLDRFQDGLRVTHAGEPSHNTVLGHSYGSTVVGYTARDNGLNADGVIFVGSPGVGVENAADLGIPPQNVWSSTAANDPIQYGYDFGSVVRAGVGLDPQVDLIHGHNPSADSFGGQVFRSDPGDPLVRWTWEGPGPFDVFPVPHFSANAHSQYWDPGSASLENIGQIVVGNRPTRS